MEMQEKNRRRAGRGEIRPGLSPPRSRGGGSCAAMWAWARPVTWMQSRTQVPAGVGQSSPNTPTASRWPLGTWRMLGIRRASGLWASPDGAGGVGAGGVEVPQAVGRIRPVDPLRVRPAGGSGKIWPFLR